MQNIEPTGRLQQNHGGKRSTYNSVLRRADSGGHARGPRAAQGIAACPLRIACVKNSQIVSLTALVIRQPTLKYASELSLARSGVTQRPSTPHPVLAFPLVFMTPPIYSRLKATSLALLSGLLLHGAANAQNLLDLVEATTTYDAKWQATLAEREAVARRSDQAKAQLLPTLGVGAELSRAQTRINPSDARFTGSTQAAALTASQPLYAPNQRIAWDQSKLAIQQMDALLNTTAQDLIIRVAKAYFAALVAQDTLTVVQAQKVAVEQQLAFAQRKFEIGNTTITDVREAQAQYDLVKAQEISALNTLQVKQLDLRQVTGQIDASPAPLALPIELPAIEPSRSQDWVARAQAEQPAIQQALWAVDIAKLETKRAQTGHLPTVNLTARLSHNNTPDGSISNPGVSSRTNQGSIGVALNLPLFAGFAVQNRVKETLSLEEKARAQLEQAQRETTQNTQTAFFNLQSGLSEVQALEAAEQSSLSSLQANELGYQVGVRINIDVLNAQTQLYRTRRDLAQARYNVLLGNLLLEQAAGSLNLDSVRRINAYLALDQSATSAATEAKALGQ